MRKNLFLVTTVLLLSYNLLAQVTNDKRILLQGFYWESAADYPGEWYDHVNGKVSQIKNAGIDLIWLPPPSDAGSLEGYLPRELNKFSNSYGNLTEHKDLLTKLGNNNIDAIADIVINHRVGSTNWYDFKNPTWGTNSITANDEVFQQFPNLNPRGSWDTGTAYGPARDVDHTKSFVRASIKEFLNNLKAIGYDGWRYDFVHGFAPRYFTEYNNATNPSFSVGENWNENKQVIQDWIDNVGNTTAFDFSTYYALKGAIRDNNYSYLAYQGAPSGGIGWDPRRYTTFVENHDTPEYDPVNNVLNGGNVGKAYAYLLTHPGVPTIFWSHMFEWGNTVKNQITALSKLRKSAGVHSQSQTTILRSSRSVYAARIKGTNKDLITKIGYGSWSPQSAGIGGNWVLETSGNDYAVWSLGTSNSLTVYVKNFSKIYAWTGSGNNVNRLTGNWPGRNLQNAGNGWKKYTLPVQCANIIFNRNNGSTQTSNLYTCGPVKYWSNNSWRTGVPSGASRKGEIALNHSFSISPNPIDNSMISFSLDESADVKLSIITAKGTMSTLLDEKMTAGEYHLGLDRKLLNKPGIYYARLHIGTSVQTQKIIVQ